MCTLLHPTSSKGHFNVRVLHPLLRPLPLTQISRIKFMNLTRYWLIESLLMATNIWSSGKDMRSPPGNRPLTFQILLPCQNTGSVSVKGQDKSSCEKKYGNLILGCSGGEWCQISDQPRIKGTFIFHIWIFFTVILIPYFLSYPFMETWSRFWLSDFLFIVGVA